MTGTDRPAVPRWVLLIHGAQALLAIVILGLDAYGIRWIAYNVLIYSLVCAICTLGVCAYMFASHLFLPKIFNIYLALGLHAWMLLFWVIDMGLVAALARTWSSPYCTYSYYYGYSCTYGKRDLHNLAKRDDTTYGAYYGALAAGAVFGAAELVLWAASAAVLVIYVLKGRSNTSNQHQPAVDQPVPQPGPNNGQPVQMEKYGHTASPQPPQYQQPYSGAPTPQQHYAQPVPVPQPQGQYTQQPQPVYNQQQPQPVYNQQQQFPAPYPQDPVPRQSTVSPVSQAGYPVPPSNVSELSSPQQYQAPSNPNVSELSTPQHTGGYNPNAVELPNQR